MQVSTDMPSILTSPQKGRLDAAFSLQPVDRTPMLGGWIADPAKILELTGTSEERYWSDPVPVSIEAYRRLGLDGLLDVNVPSERGGYTLVTHKDIEERARYKTPEDVVVEIDRLPSPEEVQQRFDEQDVYDRALARMEHMQELCGSDLYWCPARWEVIPNFEWYRIYGYEPYLIAIAAYPDQIARLYEHAAAAAACNARVIARLVRENRHPRAMLCGMDICSQRGPLVDPGFLRERYWPLVRDAVKPLRQAGAKLVWHCDGDVRPVAGHADELKREFKDGETVILRWAEAR